MLGISSSNSSGGDSGSFRKLKRDSHQGDNSVEEAAGNNSEKNVVNEEDSFQVDLRVHVVSQDVIFKDEERMTKIQTLVDKLQDGYRISSHLIKRFGKESYIQHVQRSIEARNQKVGQH